jgi:site-specific DNA-cytosine methylase
MGGASEGFYKEGFDCMGIEIDSEIAKLYPYRVIVADMRNLKGEDFKDFDVVWGSPPCRDFSVIGHAGKALWKRPPQPEVGLELVNCYLEFVENAEPKIWIMENVPNLAKYISLKPRIEKARLAPYMQRNFWGNFPDFLIPMDGDRKKHRETAGWYVKTRASRARIPLPCSLAFAQSCKQKLLEKEATEKE